MNFLPAFYFPTTLVCVDDKPTALEIYGELFKGLFKCECYKDASSVENFFQNYESELNKIQFLNKISEFEHSNTTTQSAIGLDISKIINLSKNDLRYKEATVLLADYYILPGMNGLELCRNLQRYKTKKMIITEERAYNVARDALNSGVIDYFLNKTDSLEQIKEAAQNLAIEFFCDITAGFKQLLEIDGNIVISDPAFITYFMEVAKSKHISEYYLIDKNGSYLLRASDGKEYLLVVHNDNSLTEFLDILSEYDNLKNQAEAIKRKQMIPFLGIQKEISEVDLSDINKYLFNAHVVNGREPYYVHLMEYND